MFKSRQFIIGIIISLVFFVVALFGVKLDQVWLALQKANYFALVPALALYFVGVWVRAVRWRILLQPILNKTTSITRTFEVVVIGYMANDVLPARIGELVRAYILSLREGVKKTATLATILVERIFDGITMVGFAAAAIVIILITDHDRLTTGADHKLGSFLSDLRLPIILAAVLFLGLLVIFLVVASSRSRTEKLMSFFIRRLPGRLRERATRLSLSFLEGLASLRSGSSMLAVLGLSLVAWMFEASMYYVIGTWGFDLRGSDGQLLPFYVYLLVTGFVNLGTLIPQGPGFVGVFEFIAQGVLVGAFGVLPDPSISYVLVLHAALLIPVTLLGFFYLWRQSISYADLVKLEETRAEAAVQAHELEGPLTDIELAREGNVTGGEAEARLEKAGESRT